MKAKQRPFSVFNLYVTIEIKKIEIGFDSVYFQAIYIRRPLGLGKNTKDILVQIASNNIRIGASATK